MRKRIAIIGTGISGLTAAYKLQNDHNIVVFESAAEIGGHTATKDICFDGQQYAIDTGFIVFNDWTYPNFIALMDELGVSSQPTSMGFSLSCRQTGLEYSGTNLRTLFAQKRNLFRPRHYQMLSDILRFNQQAQEGLEAGELPLDMTLGEYLRAESYSDAFRRFYLVPMASAIWSTGPGEVEEMPLTFFVRFFKNHGLLNVKNRPQWRVLKGGSRSYLGPITAGFKSCIRKNCPVISVRRTPVGVMVDSEKGSGELFDEVVFACHSDQALKILSDASVDEQRVLSAIPYSSNEVVLHTDTGLLPRNRRTWSSWNYLLGRDANKAVLTYDMNILQGISSKHTFCVTMNATEEVDPDKILGTYQYSHPEFGVSGIQAQQEWDQVNGVNRTWFCGAWWRNGFHEDGVVSALRVAEAIGESASEQVQVA